jgi:hypothetical protein
VGQAPDVCSEFSPIGGLFILGSFLFEKQRSSPNVWATFSTVLDKKMDWDTFCAIFFTNSSEG